MLARNSRERRRMADNRSVTDWRHRHLLGIKELTREDIETVFGVADRFMEVLRSPVRYVPALRDFTVATLFFEPSTRTRMSFELAAKRLSAEVISFSPGTSSLQKGETILDTVANVLAMGVDLMVVRHASSGTPHLIAECFPQVAVVNGGDGTHEHPTQALLDTYTLRREYGTLKGLRVAIVGDILHSRVARSNILCLKKLGAEVMVCAPPALLPHTIEKWQVAYTTQINIALRWCDVVYVLRIQKERQQSAYISSMDEYSHFYAITMERLLSAGKPFKVMHPGPMNRGIEIDSRVADAPHSLILQQVEHGVAVRMAVLYLIATARGHVKG